MLDSKEPSASLMLDSKEPSASLMLDSKEPSAMLMILLKNKSLDGSCPGGVGALAIIVQGEGP